MDVDPELWAMVMSRMEIKGTTHLEAVVSQLTWKPAFLVENQIPGFAPHKKWYPETMSKDSLRLARTWAELCRYVLMRLGSPARFNVGFVFSDSMTACCLTDEEERNWLLLNPLRAEKLKATVYREANVEGDFEKDKRKQDGWRVREDLFTLFALAIHEVTHLADDVGYHDEDFAAAFTKNVALTTGAEKEVRAIARSAARRLGEI